MNRTLTSMLVVLLGISYVLADKPTTTTAQAHEAEIRLLISDAREQTTQRHYREALAIIDQILKLDPTNDYALGVRPLVEDRTLPSEPRPKQPMQSQLDKHMPDVKFDLVQFDDVVDFLRDLSGATISVNWRALEKAGLKKDTPITARMKDATFSQILNEVLSQAGKGKLRFDVDDDVIVISTDEDIHATTRPSKS